MLINPDASRREFLRGTARLSAMGAASAFAGTLGMIGEASAADAPSGDYKALVCIFLFGGMDQSNTMIPSDPDSYAAYAAARPPVAIPGPQLDATYLTPLKGDMGGRAYSFHPSMAPLMPLWRSGRLATLLNVGTLMEPTTKAAYQKRTARLPSNLFSHENQQAFFQAVTEDPAIRSGWGGRMGDLFRSSRGLSALTCINTSGNAVFVSGRDSLSYSMSPQGAITLGGTTGRVLDDANAVDAARALLTMPSDNLLANEYVRITSRAVHLGESVARAVGSVSLPRPMPSDRLGMQLSVVAKSIGAAPAIGNRRQVFFVSFGGWDLHDSLLGRQKTQLSTLSSAMAAFQNNLDTMGLADKVTTFTASDFGRTLAANSDGSDHGWGSMHMVMGGAVNGGTHYGRPPVVAVNGPDDVGGGRLLPTTSVDQYASTLAGWLGISDAYLRYVLPNIGSFDRSTWNLGFMDQDVPKLLAPH